MKKPQINTDEPSAAFGRNRTEKGKTEDDADMPGWASSSRLHLSARIRQCKVASTPSSASDGPFMRTSIGVNLEIQQSDSGNQERLQCINNSRC